MKKFDYDSFQRTIATSQIMAIAYVAIVGITATLAGLGIGLPMLTAVPLFLAAAAVGLCTAGAVLTAASRVLYVLVWCRFLLVMGAGFILFFTGLWPVTVCALVWWLVAERLLAPFQVKALAGALEKVALEAAEAKRLAADAAAAAAAPAPVPAPAPAPAPVPATP